MNYATRQLENSEIRELAPSAFATEPYADRSNRYTYVPTVNVIEGMRQAGYGVFGAVQCKSRNLAKREHTKHMIRFRHADATLSLQTVPEVVMVNSHDGSCAYRLLVGIFRIICSNGMIAGDIHDSVSIRHQGNIIDAVIEGSNRIATTAPLAIEKINQWNSLMLTAGEQEIFADAARTIRFADVDGKVNTPITTAQLLAPRRMEDVGPDLWHTLNRVQENLIKGGLSVRSQNENGSRGRRVSTRRVNGIDQDVKLNAALWTLATKMAELKAS